MAWLTDSLNIQKGTETNVFGSILVLWETIATIKVDAQPINKEKVHKEYGLTDSNQFLQVFAPTNSGLVEGNQVEYDGQQWLVRVVNKWGKIDRSNHDFGILSRVI